MNFEQFLKDLGLTEKEVGVYGALLEYGEMHVSAMSVKTHINRVALYATVKIMIEKGLVSVAKNGKRKLYRAENPEKLESLFEEKKKSFDKNMHKLKKIYSRKKKRPVITFREGQKGINETYEDIVYTLAPHETFYRYSSRKDDDVKSEMSQSYFAMRDKKRLQRYVIVGEVKGKKKKKKLDREMKIIPAKQDLFNDDVSQIIYEDKVAFIDYENKISFVIESEKIATFQRKLFKMLYKTL